MTGDLSRKKLMPAVYDLANRGLLPPGFALVGFARRDWEDQDFAEVVHDAVKQHARTEYREETWKQLLQGIRFVSGEFDDPDAFRRLRETVEKLDVERGTMGNHAYYLSIPPKDFPLVAEQLKSSGLVDDTADRPDRWRRVVIEKPFGHDLDSARALNDALRSAFPTDSIFRIDHYLGKETVQNILALRFANELYEPIWNRNYVDHVQITMAEDIGVGGRAGYYDGIGAARDVIQNHLLQLMALTAMEEPISFNAAISAPRRRRCSPRSRCPRTSRTAAARGQYAGGWQGGEKVRGFLEEDGMAPDSTTETYAAIKLEIEHPPLGGRAVLPAHRQAPGPPGDRDRGRVQARAAAPVLAQPDLGARPERARHPRAARRGRHDPLRLQGAGRRHAGARRHDGLRLRPRVHRGEPRGLRAPHPRRAARRPAAVPAARRGRAVVEDPRPVRGVLGEQGGPLEQYSPGSWGPPSADELLARDGRIWRRP